MRLVHYIIVAYIIAQTCVSMLTEYCTKKGVVFGKLSVNPEL